MLYGLQDVQKLQKAKFHYTVRVADLDKRVQANRRADRRYAARAAQAGGSALPSGHTTYRHLADYELELKQLAGQYPKLVKPITLAHKTHEGRDVVGIEIATNPYKVNDGKPIFANIGHAPRQGVAGGGEHARVGVRPADQLRQERSHHAAGEGHAQHRRSRW